MRDIESRNDIEKLLKAFYNKAFADDLIGVYFIGKTNFDLKKHLPSLIDFWDSILFNSENYKNNIIDIHNHLNSIYRFRPEYFLRWEMIFLETVDDLFTGYIAEIAKQKATSFTSALSFYFIDNNK